MAESLVGKIVSNAGKQWSRNTVADGYWLNSNTVQKFNENDKTLAEAIESVSAEMGHFTPEIMPDEAKKGNARVVATGRSDFPNQINNVLVFPGIFRGALDVKAKDITEEMKIAAAKAIASIVTDEELSEEYIIPNAFDKRVVKAVSAAVAKAADK